MSLISRLADAAEAQAGISNPTLSCLERATLSLESIGGTTRVGRGWAERMALASRDINSGAPSTEGSWFVNCAINLELAAGVSNTGSPIERMILAIQEGFSSYLLDDVGSDIYWAGALFRLKSDFSGTAAKVRRADGTVANIALDGDWIDSAAIAAHCGATVGTVIELGDQSESGNYAVEISAVPSWSPQIYNGSAVITDPDNGNPAMYFPSGTYLLQSNNSDLVSGSAYTHFCVAHRDINATNMALTDSRATQQCSLSFLSDDNVYALSGIGTCKGTYGTGTNIDVFLGVLGAGTSNEIWFGGSQQGTGNGGTNDNYGFRLGVSSAFSNFFEGYIQGAGVYNASKSADMQTISDRLNDFAGAY